MFEKLRSRLGRSATIEILAPLKGEAIPVAMVNDPTFSEEMLGKGCAIRPAGGRVVAPVSGVVNQMFDTGHAVSLTSQEGVEVLIHVGLDTIRLKGAHYTVHAQTGDKVSAGDLLMEFDGDAIAAAGYDTVTPIVICNSEDYEAVELAANGAVEELDTLIVIRQ